MRTRLSIYLLLFIIFSSCEARKIPEQVLPDSDQYLRLQALIDRIGSLQFHPAEEERMYPFTFAFRKAKGGKIIRQGEGFVLLHKTLWCLVQHWQDNQTDKPGHRMLIFDRRERKFEAEVRRWPEGNLKQRWNHWTCIRVSVPDDEELGLYHCEYYYPDGTEHVTRNLKEWDFYGSFMWNEDGLLERMTRFSNSSVQYRYEGLKVKRIEFRRGETIATYTEFTYK
jgi:hypothetical protein